LWIRAVRLETLNRTFFALFHFPIALFALEHGAVRYIPSPVDDWLALFGKDV
jgi:hypothetical protein